jgi:hypothetical protein
MKSLSRVLSGRFGLALRNSRRFLPSFGRILAGASVLALLFLVYLTGAAVMYFRLPTSVYLTKAFMGAQDWSGRKDAPALPAPHGVGKLALTLDRKGVACDGFTLCLTSDGPQATLHDMQGNVVHQWNMPAHLDWPTSPGVRVPMRNEFIHWDNVHVFPNGDLLALCARNDGPYGYALVKLDRDSHFIWAYSANVHHSFDVGADGRIYALTQRFDADPPPGFPATLRRYIAEDLVVLSPDGNVLNTIPLYEAFRDTRYYIPFISHILQLSVHVGSSSKVEDTKAPSPADTILTGDILHSNSVKVLPQALAAKFPQFKPGWVLLSFRTPSIIALVDPEEKRQVVWAVLGPWLAQHDAQFLEDGHLLLFDNNGSPYGARVLEYDPVSQAIPWAYTSEEIQPMRVSSRGACQRLSNGNTLIVVPELSVFEVTANKETVWELSVPNIVLARRYAPDSFSFLPVGTSPRTE